MPAVASMLTPERKALLQRLYKARGRISGGIALFLFLAALFALRHLLHGLHFSDIIDHLRGLSARALAISVGCAVVSYIALSGYDWGGLRYVNAKVSFPRVLLTSFIAYAISNNLSFALLSGGSVRFRFYSMFGVPPLDIAKIALFCACTFTVGITLIGSAGLLLEPKAVAAIVHLPPPWITAGGIVALSATGALLIAATVVRGQITVAQRQIKVPSPHLLFGEIIVSTIDLLSAASCLYVLLPDRIPFGGFVAVYSAALAAGILSHVPGGLGIFEAVLVLGLAPKIPAAAVLGAIFLYRLIYYFLPLVMALLLFGGHEIRRQRRRMRRLARYMMYRNARRRDNAVSGNGWPKG